MKKYSCYIENEELKEFLDSKANISDFIRKILEDLQLGKLNYSQGDLDIEYKKLRNVGKELDNQIKLERLAKTPIPLTEKPIEVTSNPNFPSVALPKTKNEKTFLALEEIDPVRFLDFLRFINNEWVLKCKFCGNSLTETDRDKVLKEYARHLKSIHETEIKKYYGIE